MTKTSDSRMPYQLVNSVEAIMPTFAKVGPLLTKEHCQRLHKIAKANDCKLLIFNSNRRSVLVAFTKNGRYVSRIRHIKAKGWRERYYLNFPQTLYYQDWSAYYASVGG